MEKRGYRDWAEIAKKRRIKRAVREHKISALQPDVPPVTAAAIPICVRNTHPRLYFAASREDMVQILELLPPGSLNCLAKVVLRAGTRYVNSHATEGIPDPYLYRKSVELMPGVWLPVIRGTYCLESNSVELFGYVTAPDAHLSSEHTLELRFQMLRTLVHEVAHHNDRTQRVARGRWRMDDEAKSERYANLLT
ncbi:MAG: hypothetical protein OEO79_19295, partial [Gemmatimonadota bacterium]|nr:hypothetical protein [Gemmatimonadota bacterium]